MDLGPPDSQKFLDPFLELYLCVFHLGYPQSPPSLYCLNVKDPAKVEM